MTAPLLGPPAMATDFSQHECPWADTEPFAPEEDSQADKKLVIIIDDMGHNLARGKDALALPGKLTFAVIPYTPFGHQLANEAHGAGKEIMLHAPMSNLHNIPLGRGGLTPEQSRLEFRRELDAALADVPHVQGINNHMGSDLTQRRQQMSWLMEELRWQDLYFVDSKTSNKSVAASVAKEFDVPNLSRHIFLDNDISYEAIDLRFQELLDIVDMKGMAVAIGHPYPQTISYLQDALPQLHVRGIELVFVSEVLNPQRPINFAGLSTAGETIPGSGC